MNQGTNKNIMKPEKNIRPGALGEPQFLGRAGGGVGDKIRLAAQRKASEL